MSKNSICAREVTALILAGGEGRRMDGQDKGLLTWRRRPLITYMLDVIPKDIAHLIISCNRNIEQYNAYGTTVQDTNYEGPLAGIYAAMQIANTSYLLVLPCDSPLAPLDIYEQLAVSLTSNNADICYAHDGEREQYLFALIRIQLKESLQEYLEAGNRQVHRWYEQHKIVKADFRGQQFAFKNCNSQADLAELN
ncbi:molybdenum cofactor guanylyltransferase MobA [Zhongshania aquimaris]|uniref:Molybdenum cofactor guanylyltransferase n=1 Tax=Zhongshania aquimaris TaxID=2857107 RepID=A0ABS6VML4_9GAMM|nr:molybdenum cofactor guanylyltransferase MobA [Zhongshania aquimaris]MBW2939562.1 molybdenum cofactor guanylyltransferase [Zhongshania aquimaris]